MSAEDEDLKELKRILGELAAEVRCRDDFGVRMIDNLSSRFDDYVANQRISVKPASEREYFSKRLAPLRWLKSQATFSMYGPQSKDPFTCMYLDILMKNGVISRAQLRVINNYSMVISDSLKGWVIYRPPQSAYDIATWLLVVIVIAAIQMVVLILEHLSGIVPTLVMAYTAGHVIGYLSRCVFDHAWGRDRAVESFKNGTPWIRVGMAGR